MTLNNNKKDNDIYFYCEDCGKFKLHDKNDESDPLCSECNDKVMIKYERG